MSNKNAIEELKQNKTILIIAHKFENLKTIDNIFEVKNGHIENIFTKAR